MQNPILFDRRNFIKGAGALGVSAVALWSGGCDSWWQKIKDRPTRKNIANLPANDPIIQTYDAAVAAMIALPASDGRNWTKQAEIHNFHCTHGNWWFLPWHRAYLFYFESIIRKLTGNNDFALPYWNWTTSPSIPAPFWSGNLNHSPRFATSSSVASSSMVGATKITSILNQTNFILFASDQSATPSQNVGYGELEGTPHNYIHGFVGGDMGSYMSPLDPIFWCHHNMIECLWVEWNVNRGNPNTNDSSWVNQQFTDFVDGDGNPVTIGVATTLLMPLLSYQFEPCAPGRGPHIKMDKAELEKFLREGAPTKLEYIKRYEVRKAVTAELQKAAPTRLKVEPDAFRTLMDSAAREKAILTVDEVENPPKQDVFVRVFINKPDADANTPIEDPHYAGSFAFFCCSDDKSHAGMAAQPTPKLRYLVDLTETLRKLNQGGSLAADMDVTLVAVPFENRKVETQRVTMNRLEIGVARF
jgi:tyrosinase